MAHYSYEKCLQRSYQVNWRIEDVLGYGGFDPHREWLPKALSATPDLKFLASDERRKLTHLEMASYAHLFGYAEEFVTPLLLDLARDYETDERTPCHALTNFAAEEVKHMNLFRQLRDRIEDDLGFELALLGGQKDMTRLVLSKSRGAVLLLASCIEWVTQRHYRECFHDSASQR